MSQKSIWEQDKELMSGIFEQVWEQVKPFFAAQMEGVWKEGLASVQEAIEIALETTLNWLSGVEDDQWDYMLGAFVAADVLTEDQKQSLKKMKDLITPLDLLMFAFSAITLSTGYIKNLLLPGLRFSEQAMNQQFRPNLPYFEHLLAAALVAPEKTGEIRDIMARLGFPEKAIDLLFLSMYRTYPEETIRTLWLREVLSDEEMFMRMRELGFTDRRTKEVIQGWSLLPSPQDLFWMVGKEAFEPDIYNRIGLDQEFPTEQVKWLKRQGISEEWAKKYWIAHWDQPSIQMGYEMLHRGVIGHEELDILFRAVEMPPFWRDKLTEIAYMPYTRVDVRRMHDMGVLTNEETYRAYLDLGYNEEKAYNMLRFTIKYNQQNDKELSMTQIRTSYTEGAIDKATAIDMLTRIDYSKDQADYLLTLEDFKEAKKLQDEQKKVIGNQYKKNLIDRNQAEQQLNQMDLTGNEIAVLMGKWDVSKVSNTKRPSRKDLDAFLVAGIITKDQYRLEMRNLGYGSSYTDWYEQLATKGVE